MRKSSGPSDWTEALLIASVSTLCSCSSPSETAFHDGSKHVEQGQYEAAIDDFSRAIKLDPKSQQAYDWRGYAYGN